MKTFLKSLLALLLIATSAFAQAPTPPNNSSLAVIRFTFDHDQMEIPHYSFDVDSSGRATYKSVGKPESDGQPETLQKEFKLSGKTRERIFELAKKADYFNGNFDFTKIKIAFSGKKTLSYSDATRTGTTTVNWSENPAITELNGIFQGISTTLEAEPRLRRLRRYDKLGLNAELAGLERQAQSGWLKEMVLIEDILREISQDGTIMGLARKRADHLLQIAASQR
ncbi:MAG: hypothetical protein JWO13_932 [Acidobacteriales bacterium]|nr:hypothetical protein [Terriglobales bacterium]